MYRLIPDFTLGLRVFGAGTHSDPGPAEAGPSPSESTARIAADSRAAAHAGRRRTRWTDPLGPVPIIALTS